MDEYIKREKAIAKFEEIKKSGVSLRDAAYLDAVMAVLDNIEAEDVSPIVRCKECAYWNRSSEIMPDGEKADYGWCGKLLDADSETEVVTSEKDFCSYGEKKGDNEI